VQRAADLFRAVYDETDGQDGFVSLEISPHLADDTAGTIAEARRFWARLARSNVMIKVPATPAGIPAIRQLTREGVNINVILLFSLDRYREVLQRPTSATSSSSAFMGRPAGAGSSGRTGTTSPARLVRRDPRVRRSRRGEATGTPLRLLYDAVLGKD